jgi:formylglycine-generating enzyme required for sulfatase activity
MAETDQPDFISDWVKRKPQDAAQTPGSIGLLRRVLSGPFMMGSRFHFREAPRREVFVAEFEMVHVPVTVAQYTVFLEAGGADGRPWWSEAGWAWRQGIANGWGRVDRSVPDDWVHQKYEQQNPVTGVTLYEAEAYGRWLSAMKNRVVRLPTEPEWEKAARGDDSRPWPWGDDFSPEKANTFEREAGKPLPVGSCPEDVSPYQLFDMGGNVQEWTASAYRPAPDEHFPDKDLRVAKGGSWNDTGFGARTSYRHIYPPGYYFPFLGFRIVVAMK